MLGAIGLVLSSAIRQLENFASVMNFVIFPMFFYVFRALPTVEGRGIEPLPPWRLPANPFTHAVELIRFALHGRFEPLAFAVVAGVTVVASAIAVAAYDPMRRKA